MIPSPSRVANRHRSCVASGVEVEWLPSLNRVSLVQDGEEVGYLILVPDLPMPELLEHAKCPKALTTLHEQYGDAPVWKGWNTSIKYALRRQGYGLQMYALAVRELRKREGRGFYFVSSNCGKKGEGSTTEAAVGVWRALARSHPSSNSGQVMFIR